MHKFIRHLKFFLHFPKLNNSYWNVTNDLSAYYRKALSFHDTWDHFHRLHFDVKRFLVKNCKSLKPRGTFCKITKFVVFTQKHAVGAIRSWNNYFIDGTSSRWWHGPNMSTFGRNEKPLFMSKRWFRYVQFPCSWHATGSCACIIYFGIVSLTLKGYGLKDLIVNGYMYLIMFNY